MRAIGGLAGVVGAAGLALAVLPAGARAQCTSSDAGPGMVQQVCDQSGRHWVVLTADLSSPDVDIRVSRPSERAGTVEGWGGEIAGSVAAIQGGPFRFPDFEVAGFTVGAGEAWTAHDDARLGVLAVDGRGGALLADPELLVPLEDWMTAAVSGRSILRDGTVITSCAPDGCDLRPRTAIGLSEDSRSLVIVVVEGWTARSEGITDPDLAELMDGNGAFDAIRTGEGATSVLWSRAEGALIPSSDGASRPTAAFLALVNRGGAVDGRIRGVVKRAMEPLDPLPTAHVRIETTDGVVVMEVPTLVESTAYFTASLPAREYIVRALLDGYTEGCKLCSVTPGAEIWCSVFLTEGTGAETCTPEPRTIDPGVWPRGDAGPIPTDGGPRDAGVMPPPGSEDTCAAGGAARPSRGPTPALLLVALAIGCIRRAGRRQASG